LADGVSQDPTRLEEGVGGPTQSFLGGDYRPLRAGDSEDGRLQLSGLGPACLKVRQPSQLLARPPICHLNGSNRVLVVIDDMAELNSCRLFRHLAEAQNDAETEFAAHRGSPRSIDSAAPPVWTG
jgi:hypothetical protein